MQNVYLASPFFNQKQLDDVSNLEQALSKNKNIGHIFSPRKAKINYPYGSVKWADMAYKLDTKHINNADIVFANLDYIKSFVDSGTAFEVGYATKANKPVVLFGKSITTSKGNSKPSTINLMLLHHASAVLTSYDEVKDYDFNTLPEVKYSGKLM